MITATMPRPASVYFHRVTKSGEIIPPDQAPLVYISGPMTGLPLLNFPAFFAAAEQLRAAGYRVCNPAEINPDPATPWAQCMRVDIKALCDCDGLAYLDGAARSRGATLETEIARALGMPVRALAEWLAGKGK